MPTTRPAGTLYAAVATPLTTFAVVVPSTVLPLRRVNVTVPELTGPSGLTTFAVRLAFWATELKGAEAFEADTSVGSAVRNGL